MINQGYKDINDVDKLHNIIHSHESQINILQEQIKCLTDKIYGRKSEKTLNSSYQQLPLFGIPEPELPVADEPEETIITSHKRKKRGRRPLPANLPRIEVIHQLKEEDRLCKCGCIKSRIGEEISEQLDYIPAKVQVIKNIRYKYACKNCEGTEDDGPTVSIARMPGQI
ncbi:IS66 family transposase zinc-finger binding domain-containing protein, partial [Desulfobacula sp.]|uniref:IS66 family transposase n=1 Tax=Desulfobacula sp. TaxID=2593537 RepID=UPI002714CCA8